MGCASGKSPEYNGQISATKRKGTWVVIKAELKVEYKQTDAQGLAALWGNSLTVVTPFSSS